MQTGEIVLRLIEEFPVGTHGKVRNPAIHVVPLMSENLPVRAHNLKVFENHTHCGYDLL